MTEPNYKLRMYVVIGFAVVCSGLMLLVPLGVVHPERWNKFWFLPFSAVCVFGAIAIWRRRGQFRFARWKTVGLLLSALGIVTLVAGMPDLLVLLFFGAALLCSLIGTRVGRRELRQSPSLK
jgi:hypothetical protein